MPAPAPPHSGGTHMPMKPSRPISDSNGRGISPAASHARTWGNTLSCANDRAVSRTSSCSSLSSITSPRKLGAVILQVAAVVRRLQPVDHLHHAGHALLDRERRRRTAHVGLHPAGMQGDADQALARDILGEAAPLHVEGGLAGPIEITPAIVVGDAAQDAGDGDDLLLSRGG